MLLDRACNIFPIILVFTRKLTAYKLFERRSRLRYFLLKILITYENLGKTSLQVKKLLKEVFHYKK